MARHWLDVLEFEMKAVSAAELHEVGLPVHS